MAVVESCSSRCSQCLKADEIDQSGCGVTRTLQRVVWQRGTWARPRGPSCTRGLGSMESARGPSTGARERNPCELRQQADWLQDKHVRGCLGTRFVGKKTAKAKPRCLVFSVCSVRSFQSSIIDDRNYFGLLGSPLFGLRSL